MDYSDTLAVEGGPLQVQPMATSAPPSNVPTAGPFHNFGYDLAVCPCSEHCAESDDAQ